MPVKLTVFLLLTLLVCSCSKPEVHYNENNPYVDPLKILVDASKDGGVWWFPQYGTYSPGQPHQGKALVEYLRSLGYAA